MMTRALQLIGIVALVGCVDHHKGATAPLTPEPVFYANNVKNYGETAAGLPPDTVYAWDLRVAGDVARYYECSAVDACGKVERTRPAKELLGMQKAGKAEVDGEVVTVMKLSVEPKPTYVVPNWKPTPAGGAR